MGNRRALLIGAEAYGDGFAPLPAVHQDIKLMESALVGAGYTVMVCGESEVSNASLLWSKIEGFCQAAESDDSHIIYFSGHGMSVAGADCIIPAGVSRKNASWSPNHRVSTDFSPALKSTGSGLVVFIIDACRDKADAPIEKGRSEWGSPENLADPGQHRFVRFFGCGPGEVCQIVPGEPAVSVFSRALADEFAESPSESLNDFWKGVRKRCKSLTDKHILKPQSPRLSVDDSADQQEVLNLKLFDRSKSPIHGESSALGKVWEKFDPNRLHCVVITSEFEARNRVDRPLPGLVEQVVLRRAVWDVFRSRNQGMRLTTGEERKLSESNNGNIRFATFSILDALVDWPSLDTAIRATIEADIAVFDVTGFEPGMMILAGVRGATRRGISICSHGGGWIEGSFLPIPFNLQNISIGSHTPPNVYTGKDLAADRLADRIEAGLQQLRLQKNYTDLPGYSDLRQLGSEYDASSTINPSERILVLCSFAEEHHRVWIELRSSLSVALGHLPVSVSPRMRIERVVDAGSPQAVSQTIYERIRRSAGCLADWTRFSRSVFFELGARLAVSEWGAVQIVRDASLSGESGAETTETSGKKWDQVDRMRKLFSPIPYVYPGISPTAKEISQLLFSRNPTLDGDQDYNRIHRVAVKSLERVQECRRGIVAELIETADSLHHPKQGAVGAPTILFYRSSFIKKDSEREALERRIGAWLYLHHRVISSPDCSAIEHNQYFELGRALIGSLYEKGGEADFKLAEFIETNTNKQG